MAHTSCRILVVDSSVARAQELCGTFAKAGWEIWPGRNVQDALLLAARLSFNVVVAHESSTRHHPELWAQLAESAQGACWIVHNSSRRAEPWFGCAALDSDPVLILAVLMLLLETQPPATVQAQAA